MRYTLILLLIILTTNAFGQLTYLGEDRLPKGGDPYQKEAFAGGMVAFDGAFYYTTPTGKLYRTDGSQDGTDCVYTANNQSLPILAATNRFLYIGAQDPGYASFMHRYKPGSSKLEPLYLEQPRQAFRFNNNRLPGYNLMADALAVSPDRKNIAFRIYINDGLSLNVIPDEAPEKARVVKYCSPAEIASMELSIHPSSDIAFVRNEIFVNGCERDLLTAAVRTDGSGNSKLTRTGSRAFTAVSVIKKPDDATTWYIGSYYHLESKGYTLYKGLLRRKDQLFALVSKAGGNTVGEHQLVRFDSTKLLLSNDKLPGGAYYTAEVHEDQIYLLTTGKIYRYDLDADKFINVFSDTGSGWNQIFDTDLMLKSGRYLLTRVRNRILLIDENRGSAADISPVISIPEPNRFSFGDRYAWATKHAFYFMDTVAGANVFTRFNPATRAFRPIAMPVVDRKDFVRFRAVFQLDDRFLLMAEYRDRKRASSYQMFLYRDERD